jgi:hypothetical protein
MLAPLCDEGWSNHTHYLNVSQVQARRQSLTARDYADEDAVSSFERRINAAAASVASVVAECV